MPSLPQFPTSFLPKLTLIAVIDILAVAFLIYQFIAIVRGRRAAHVLSGIGVLLVVYLAAVGAGLDLLRSTLETLAPYTAFGLIVMFQSEIRRMLARLGRRRWLGFGGRLQRREAFDEILLALRELSQEKIGALIVVERDIGLRTFVESGVALDAALSHDLLLSIFHPGGSLHDGAVIVQGDRIAAAACFLPLSPQLAGKGGTRHRAATGITEETDCLALVGSEKTGRLSVAAFGEIELGLTMEQVEARLIQHFGKRGGPRANRAVAPEAAPEPASWERVKPS